MTGPYPDLRYLSAFMAVCELGSLRAAAESLHRTEPTISYQLRMLQTEVGIPLFDRVGRRLMPNHAGRTFFEYARTVTDRYRQIYNEMAGSDPIATAPLRLASVSGFGRYVLVPRLTDPAFRLHRVELSFGTAEEVTEMVVSGDVDVGFVFKRPFATRLTFTPIYQEELVFIAKSGAKRFFSRRIEELEQIPFITYEEGDFVFSRWFEHFFSRQPAELESAYHFDEVEEVARFVREGYGVSIVPFDSVRAEVQRQTLQVIRPFRRGRCLNTVFSVQRVNSYTSPIVHKIIQSIVKKQSTRRE